MTISILQELLLEAIALKAKYLEIYLRLALFLTLNFGGQGQSLERGVSFSPSGGVTVGFCPDSNFLPRTVSGCLPRLKFFYLDLNAFV